MRIRLSIPGIALGACFLWPVVGQSAAITAGSVSVVPSSFVALVSFQLGGTGFSVAGVADGVVFPPAHCSPFCPAGSALPVDFAITGSELPSNFWVGGGAVTSGPLRPSFLIFTGPPIFVPGPGVYAGSFALVGSLCGFPNQPVDQPPPPCNPDLPTLTGSGFLELTMAHQPDLSGGPELVRFISARYTFVEPVPEPSTGAVGGFALALGVLVFRYKWLIGRHGNSGLARLCTRVSVTRRSMASKNDRYHPIAAGETPFK
jgi:hypothetical protein